MAAKNKGAVTPPKVESPKTEEQQPKAQAPQEKVKKAESVMAQHKKFDKFK